MIEIWKHFLTRARGGWLYYLAFFAVSVYNIQSLWQEGPVLGLISVFVFFFGIPGAVYVIDHS